MGIRASFRVVPACLAQVGGKLSGLLSRAVMHNSRRKRVNVCQQGEEEKCKTLKK